jgi:hypothetical protein
VHLDAPVNNSIVQLQFFSLWVYGFTLILSCFVCEHSFHRFVMNLNIFGSTGILHSCWLLGIWLHLNISACSTLAAAAVCCPSLSQFATRTCTLARLIAHDCSPSQNLGSSSSLCLPAIAHACLPPQNIGSSSLLCSPAGPHTHPRGLLRRC